MKIKTFFVLLFLSLFLLAPGISYAGQHYHGGGGRSGGHHGGYGGHGGYYGGRQNYGGYQHGYRGYGGYGYGYGGYYGYPYGGMYGGYYDGYGYGGGGYYYCQPWQGVLTTDAYGTPICVQY